MAEASNSNHGTLLGESQFTRSPMYFDVNAQRLVGIGYPAYGYPGAAAVRRRMGLSEEEAPPVNDDEEHTR